MTLTPEHAAAIIEPIRRQLAREILAEQRGMRFVESFEQQLEIRKAATA